MIDVALNHGNRVGVLRLTTKTVKRKFKTRGTLYSRRFVPHSASSNVNAVPIKKNLNLVHILRLSLNLLVFGYTYPAYECFKTLEKNKPEMEQLLFWCQYWIIVAMLTIFERIEDTFISWEHRSYVYNSFFRPYVAKHEADIDHTLLELRVKAGDLAILYWQKAMSFGQTRFFEILQYVSSQSASRPKSDKVSIDNEK